MMLKIQLGNHCMLYFKIHYNRKQLLYIIMIFHKMYVFTVHLNKKCSLGEHKRLLSQTFTDSEQ